MSPIKSLLQKALRGPKDKLNILTYSTHEGYSWSLAGLNATFWNIQGGGLKEWNWGLRNPPPNHNFIQVPQANDLIRFLPADSSFDLVFCQNLFAHGNQSVQLSQQLGIPLVSLQHCMPPSNDSSYLSQVKQFRPTLQVFITAHSQKLWGWSDEDSKVIYHGIDTSYFKPDQTKRGKLGSVLSVVNEYKGRNRECGFDVWVETIRDLPHKLYGNNPGLSEPAPSKDALVEAFQSHSVFLNTSLISPCPLTTIEAAACGAAIVTTNTCAIPSIFTHGENCLMGANARELNTHCKTLLSNPDLCKKLGDGARKLAEEKFGLGRFVNEWDQTFRSVL